MGHPEFRFYRDNSEDATVPHGQAPGNAPQARVFRAADYVLQEPRQRVARVPIPARRPSVMDRLRENKGVVSFVGGLAAIGAIGIAGLRGPDCEPTGETVTIGTDIGPYGRPYTTPWEVALDSNPTNPDGSYRLDTSQVVDEVVALNGLPEDYVMKPGDEIALLSC